MSFLSSSSTPKHLCPPQLLHSRLQRHHSPWLQGSTLCTVTQPGNSSLPQVAVQSSAAAGITGACSITVTFPSLNNSALSATAVVAVDSLSALTLRTQGYDYTAATGNLAAVASNTNQYSTLQQIACHPSDYEQVGLVLSCSVRHASLGDQCWTARRSEGLSMTTWRECSLAVEGSQCRPAVCRRLSGFWLRLPMGPHMMSPR